MENLTLYIFGIIEDFLPIAMNTVFFSNIVTFLTPSSSRNAVINAVVKILNILALNIFKNTNKDA